MYNTHVQLIVTTKETDSASRLGVMPSVMRRRPSHWLRGAAAAALVAGASACSFLTSPGSPAPSAFEDASTWNAATLSARTKGQCAFMLTEPYVENFKVKNTTFWAADQFDGAQHCTGLAPSGPSVCTMASSNALTYDYPLYPPAAGTDPLGILSAGDSGLKAVISQSACLEDSSLCKFNGGESYWLGAHMESQGCIQVRCPTHSSVRNRNLTSAFFRN